MPSVNSNINQTSTVVIRFVDKLITRSARTLLSKALLLVIILLSASLATHSQPPGKHWEAVAYNETKNQLAVFSGTELREKQWFITNSLWLFDRKWQVIDGQEIDGSEIPGRWAHAMNYHNNELYIYGGLAWDEQKQEKVLNDLYRFKGSWTKIVTGPALLSPRIFSIDGRLSLTGMSSENQNSFEVWELIADSLHCRLSVKMKEDIEGQHTLLVKNEFVLVCPTDSGLNFYNVSSGSKWIVSDMPERTKFGLSYSASLDCYYLFGGLDKERNFTNDLWCIKNGHSTKMVHKNSPAARATCHLVATASGFVLYGGVKVGPNLSNEFWRYENEQWKQVVY